MSKSIVKEKIQLLKDFQIKVTAEQKQHMLDLSSEIQLDNYCRALITQKLS